jgi:hypothetical protein
MGNNECNNAHEWAKGDLIMHMKKYSKIVILVFVLNIGLIFPVFGENCQNFTTDDVITLQNQWGEGIVDIGTVYQAGRDYQAAAREMIAQMYGYDDGPVLFKPTKAADDQFRETADQALSYFVGGSVPEDHGFAIQPWSAVRFENHEMVLSSDMALAMGNYYFTDANTGKAVKVEYTLGIRRAAADGRPVIFLHHSSLPFQPGH